MLCEQCQVRRASMQLIVSTPEGKVLRQLCPVCALSLPSFFSPSPSARLLGKTCPDCGLTLKAMRETGMLGCPSCYEAFRLELHDIFMRVQGTDCHVAAAAEAKAAEQEQTAEESAGSRFTSLLALRRALREAVAEENYEEAARLRDRIRELERVE